MKDPTRQLPLFSRQARLPRPLVLAAAFLGLVWALGAWAPVTPPPSPPPPPARTGTLAPPPSKGAPQAIAPGQRADSIVVITLKGRISRFVAVSVERRLAEAVALGASAVVFDIDSTQGDLGAVSDICQMVKGSSAPRTIAWINTRATGGAAAIALACGEIIVNDPATLGEVVSPRVEEDSPRGRANQASTKSQMLSEVVDSARRRGWDEYLVQALVVPEVELWQIENAATGEKVCVDEAEYRFLTGQAVPRSRPELITGRSPSSPVQPIAPAAAPNPSNLPPLLPQPPSDPDAFRPASKGVAGIVQLAQPGGTKGSGAVLMGGVASRRFVFTNADAGKWKPAGYVSDGSGAATIRSGQFGRFGLATLMVKNEAELKQSFGATSVRTLELSWSEQLAGVLNSSIAKGILIAIFLIAMFVEMTHPGMVVPGAIAAVCLFLILGPAFVAGMASWWAIAAIVTGIVLLALELFVFPGFGVAGIIGLVVLFVGLVFTFVPGGAGGLASAQTQDELLRGVVTVLLSAVTAIFGIFFVVRQLGTIPLLERFVLKAPGHDDGDEPLSAMVKNREVTLFVGDEGVAMTDLRPAGKARFGDTIADVVAEIGYVEAGTPVRVVSAGRMRVIVDAIKGVGGAQKVESNPPGGAA